MDASREPEDLALLADSSWLEDAVRPALIAAVATCAAWGPLAVVSVMMPGQQLQPLMLFFLFTALQAAYMQQWLADPRWRWRRDWRARAGEILGLLILLRLVVWWLQGQQFSAAQVGAWIAQPETFFDVTFIVGGLLMFFVWAYTVTASDIFLQFGLTADEMMDMQQNGRERGWVQGTPQNRQALLERFSLLWLWGGVWLTLCAALTRVVIEPEPGQMFGLRTLGLAPGLVVALLVYFLGGLLLVSQGRLALLRARWQREGALGVSAATRGGRRAALLTILGVALVASLLPFGSSFGLAMLLSGLLRLLLWVMMALYLAFAHLIALLLRPLTPPVIEEGSADPPPLDVLELPAFETTPVIAPPAWVGGAIFWLIIAAIGFYFLWTAWQQRAGSRWFEFLCGWVAKGRKWWQTRWQQMAVFIRRSAGALPDLPLPKAQPRWLHWRRLSPTERTRYYYLSTVHRASGLGAARRPSQTPSEYEETLRENWPEMQTEVHDLTTRFLWARYRPQPVDEQSASLARRAWTEIKRILRAKGE